MININYVDFELLSCQASVFTPEEKFSTSKLMREFYPSWAELFNAEPLVINMPGMPADIPRVTLKSESDVWRCEVAPSRVNIHWRKSDKKSTVSLPSFFEKSTAIIAAYQEIFAVRIGRIAAIVTRFARHENPAMFLAKHFCKGKWLDAPFDRPSNFELHAHKQYPLDSNFNINSWARSKTGHLKTEDALSHVVLFEQDFNTLHEELDSKDYSPTEVAHFFSIIVPEFESIAKLYYPHEEYEIEPR